MRRLNLFADLPPGDVEFIGRKLRVHEVRRRAAIFRPGAPTDRVYIIKTGVVRIYRQSSEGRQVTITLLRPGQFLGMAALAGIGEPGTYAEALGPTVLCETTPDDFVRLICECPPLAARVVAALALRLVRVEQRLEQQTFQAVPTRLARVLAEMAEENDGRLPAKLTHADLAHYVGATRESISKVLGDFARTGLITRGYRSLVITDAAGLDGD